MADRVFERAAIALERYIAGFNESRPDREGLASASVPWSRWPVRFSRSEIPRLVNETRTVLLAKALFARDAPAWAVPLPTDDELHPLLQSTGAMHLLGRYACSLSMMSYDYLGHPSFFTFGCGVMAHPHAPEHVRDDPELQCEFPARELPGLGGRMIWLGESLPARVRAELLTR